MPRRSYDISEEDARQREFAQAMASEERPPKEPTGQASKFQARSLNKHPRQFPKQKVRPVEGLAPVEAAPKKRRETVKNWPSLEAARGALKAVRSGNIFKFPEVRDYIGRGTKIPSPERLTELGLSQEDHDRFFEDFNRARAKNRERLIKKH